MGPALGFLLLVLSIIGLAGCAAPEEPWVDPYYLRGSAEEQGLLEEYFILLSGERRGSKEQLAVIQQIANTYLRQEEYQVLIRFLSQMIHDTAEDPQADQSYNTYYRFMKAFAHQQMGALPMAALYFDMIVKNYPDLNIQGNSIHLACLLQLITLVEDGRQRVWYYEELISRFIDQIDPAPTYFLLGQAYESIGEWNSAIRAYTQFLSFGPSHVTGFPNAHNYTRHLIDFHNSPKDWTFESLPALVAAVQSALDAGSATRLWQYHARVNFFTRTWDDSTVGSAGHIAPHLADFMRRSRIRYSDNLEINSNANEAFLRTWGWSEHFSTWYLYFRKVQYPMNPDIHGRWEWAGIYYGDRF